MNSKSPPDMIFIKWGRFQAGACGKLAVTTVLAVVVGGLVSKALGLW